MTQKALLKITVIGEQNTITHTATSSTDLPADAMGEATADAMQKMWRYGEDPTKCTMVIHFGTIDENGEADA